MTKNKPGSKKEQDFITNLHATLKPLGFKKKDIHFSKLKTDFISSLTYKKPVWRWFLYKYRSSPYRSPAAYYEPITNKRKHFNIRLHSTNKNRAYTYQTEPAIAQCFTWNYQHSELPFYYFRLVSNVGILWKFSGNKYTFHYSGTSCRSNIRRKSVSTSYLFSFYKLKQYEQANRYLQQYLHCTLHLNTEEKEPIFFHEVDMYMKKLVESTM